MFLKIKGIFGLGVQHSSGYMVFPNSRFAVRYMDDLLVGEISSEFIIREDMWDGIGFLPKDSKEKKWDGIVIHPKTLKLIKGGNFIELSDEEKKVINKRIQDGLESLGLKVEVR
jgi:hypothetical protein